MSSSVGPSANARLAAEFQAAAALRGGAAALRCPRGCCCITYVALLESVRVVAAALRRNSVGVVALRLHRSPALVACILAAIDAGVPFLLADRDVPFSYFLSAWRRAGLQPLLVGESMHDGETVHDGAAASLTAVTLHALLTKGVMAAPPWPSAALSLREDVLYLCSTSGSTGSSPQLVLGSGRGTSNRISWGAANLADGASSHTALLRTPPCFVDSIAELLDTVCGGHTGILLGGGFHENEMPCLVGASTTALEGLRWRQHDDRGDAAAMVRAIAAQRVTRVTVTPQLLEALVALADASPLQVESPLASLRTVVCSGDVLRAGTAVRFARHFVRRRASVPALINIYGSAETSADAVAWQIDMAPFLLHGGVDDADAVPVGQPLPGVAVGVACDGDAGGSPIAWLHDDGTVDCERRALASPPAGGRTTHGPCTAAAAGPSPPPRQRTTQWLRPVTQAGRIVVRGVGVALGYLRCADEADAASQPTAPIPASTSTFSTTAPSVAASTPTSTSTFQATPTGEREFWSGDEGRLVAACASSPGAGNARADELPPHPPHRVAAGESPPPTDELSSPPSAVAKDAATAQYETAPLTRIASCPCGCGGPLLLQVLGRLSAARAEPDVKVGGVRVRAQQVEAAVLRIAALHCSQQVPPHLRGVPTYARYLVTDDYDDARAHLVVGLSLSVGAAAAAAKAGTVRGTIAVSHRIRAQLLTELPAAVVPPSCRIHVFAHGSSDGVDADAGNVLPPLPLLPSGKPLPSAALLALITDGGVGDGGVCGVEAAPQCAHPADPVLQLVRAAFAAVLRCDDAPSDLDFFDAGGDSLAAVRLLTGEPLAAAAAEARRGVETADAAFSTDGRRYGLYLTLDDILLERSPAGVAALLRRRAAVDAAMVSVDDEPDAIGSVLSDSHTATPHRELCAAGRGAATAAPPPQSGVRALRRVAPPHAVRCISHRSDDEWQCAGLHCGSEGGQCDYVRHTTDSIAGGAEGVVSAGFMPPAQSPPSAEIDATPSATTTAEAGAVSIVPVWAVRMRGCIDGGVLVVQFGRQQRAIVVAASHGGDVISVDAASGAVIWRALLPDHVEGAAVLHPWTSTLAVGCYDGSVYGLRVDDGSIAWRWCNSESSGPPQLRRRHIERGGSARVSGIAQEGAAQQPDTPPSYADEPPPPIKAAALVHPSGALWIAGYNRRVVVLAVPREPHATHSATLLPAVGRKRPTAEPPDVAAARELASAMVDGSVAASPVFVPTESRGGECVGGAVAIATTRGSVYLFPGALVGGNRQGDPQTLTPAWTCELRVPVFGTPAVITSRGAAAGCLLCVPGADGAMTALCARTGARVWRLEAGAPLVSSPCVAPPALHDLSGDLLVFAAHDGALLACDERGVLRWRTAAVAPAGPARACAIGLMSRGRGHGGAAAALAVAQDGAVRICDLRSGQSLAAAFRLDMGGAETFAAPVVAHGTLFVGGRDDFLRSISLVEATHCGAPMLTCTGGTLS